MPHPGLWRHGNLDCSCSQDCVVCIQVVPNAVSKFLAGGDLKERLPLFLEMPRIQPKALHTLSTLPLIYTPNPAECS